MDLNGIKDIKSRNSALTVYAKLMHLTSYLRYKKDKLNTYANSFKIKDVIKKCVNDSNFRLFNDVFLFYLILFAHDKEKNKDNNNDPYKKYCNEICKVVSKNRNEAIYHYSKFFAFYAENNRPLDTSNNAWIFLKPFDEIYNGIFFELMSEDNKTLFINFEVYRKLLARDYFFFDDIYNASAAALIIAASYSMITNDYSKFNEMGDYIVNNTLDIYDKMKADGLIMEGTSLFPEFSSNINIDNYIEYMINLLQNEEDVRKNIY